MLLCYVIRCIPGIVSQECPGERIDVSWCAVGGAIALGDYLEAGTIVFLFAFAEWLESRSTDKVRRSNHHSVTELVTSLDDLYYAELKSTHHAFGCHRL